MRSIPCLAALVVLSCGGTSSTTRTATTTTTTTDDDGTTTTTTSTTTSESEAAPPAPSSSLDPEARAMLDAHNQFRAAHCAAPLAWSVQLARTAQAWADGLRDRGCVFEHSQGGLGENLAGGTSGSLAPAGVTAMWYAEAQHYSFRRPGFSMQTGHFTQLVWRGTTELGCGRTTCNGLDLWVCNYNPPGNVERSYEENVLPSSCRAN